MNVLKSKIITTNSYFCITNSIFKGYICLPIVFEFHMLSNLSIHKKEVL